MRRPCFIDRRTQRIGDTFAGLFGFLSYPCELMFRLIQSIRSVTMMS